MDADELLEASLDVDDLLEMRLYEDAVFDACLYADEMLKLSLNKVANVAAVVALRAAKDADATDLLDHSVDESAKSRQRPS